MYSRQQAALLKEEFWTIFGQYMAPVPSSDGEKINWVNFKTGIRDIHFRMNADNKKAWISIELTHKDKGLRHIYFEQLAEFRKLLHSNLNEDWIWLMDDMNKNGQSYSRVFTEMTCISIFKKEDWPALISFFKPRITALDEFWSNVKYIFETLDS